MNTLTWIIIIVAAVAAIAFIVWAILRHRYVKSLKEKGWQFVTSPSIDVAYGLNVPPFGVGLGRRVDDLVLGTMDGYQFQVFEYKVEGTKEIRVTAVRLPWALDEFHVSNVDRPLPGHMVVRGPLRMAAADPEWISRVESALGPALQTVLHGPTTLTIDGNHVVLLDTPAKADEMEDHIRRAVTAARALSSPEFEAFARPEPPQRLGFHRTDWQYEPRNDAVLSRLQHTRGGFDHRAVDVITGPNNGLPFIAAHHKWKTRETSTDSEGRTRTRTVNHDEYLMEVSAPFPFSPISFNAGWLSGGKKREFESITFSRMFKVRSAHPKFASDVIHPRTMQWMEQQGPVEVSIFDQRVQFSIHNLDPRRVAWNALWCHGFFGRVPAFVWEDLGLRQPPSFTPTPDGPLPIGWG